MRFILWSGLVNVYQLLRGTSSGMKLTIPCVIVTHETILRSISGVFFIKLKIKLTYVILYQHLNRCTFFLIWCVRKSPKVLGKFRSSLTLTYNKILCIYDNKRTSYVINRQRNVDWILYERSLHIVNFHFDHIYRIDRLQNQSYLRP